MFRKVLLVSFIALLSLAAVLPVLATAPAEGIVFEGESVPGISLGDSRSQVEAAYGQPDSCQGPDRGYCGFPVDGGGQVFVRYHGADGGPAANLPGDIAHHIHWYRTAWTTTAGINTAIALDDPDAVIAAYPDAQVTTNQWGAVVRVQDAPSGISVDWFHDFYGGFTTVTIGIFLPSDPAPIPEQITRLIDIELTAKKVKGQREIRALLLLRNEKQLAAAGATVSATWIFPDGSSQTVTDVTSSSGYAYFELLGVPRGSYTLIVDDVVLDGYRFDQANSVLVDSIRVK